MTRRKTVRYRKSEGNLSPDQPGVRVVGQAEGERDDEISAKVERTPGQAEGDRETIEKDLREKSKPVPKYQG